MSKCFHGFTTQALILTLYHILNHTERVNVFSSWKDFFKKTVARKVLCYVQVQEIEAGKFSFRIH